MSLTTPSAHASQAARPPVYEVGERHAFITILSYNIKGLPRVAGVEHDRFRDIGLELAEMRKTGTQPNIVLLQEAFVRSTRDLRDAAGYVHAIPGPGVTARDEKGRMVAKPLNAGLWVLTDFEVSKSANVAFDRKLSASWGRWANKGVQAVRLKVPGIPFEFVVANTHAQAGQSSEQIRMQQFNIIWRFLEKFAEKNEPLFAIGDFNAFPARESYQNWMKTTSLLSVSETCLQGFVGCRVVLRNNKSLEYSPDQHFFRSGRSNQYDVEIRPVFVEHIFHEPVKGRLLSDHWGYNVTYEIKW